MALTRRSRSLTGDNNREIAGDHRSPKRQRLPPHEEENEDSNVVSVGEEEEEEDSQSGRSSSSKSPQSIKLKSSDLLDCSTCCKPLSPPIYQCKNGDLACSSCCKKLNKKCPVRCRAVEKIIEATIVPCANAIYGCKETTTYGNQSRHHEMNLCVFTPCSCPLPRCNYVGTYKDLKLHVLATHSYYDYNINFPFVFNSPTIFSIDLGKNKMVVLQEKKEGVLFVVQAFKRSLVDDVYVTVSRIAPPGVVNYSCSLAKLSEFSTVRVGMMVKKFQKVVVKEKEEDLEDDDGFILIPSKKLVGYRYWKMEIRIGRGYAYIHI